MNEAAAPTSIPLSAVATAAAVRAGTRRATEVVAEAIARIEARNGDLAAFTDVLTRRALAKAAALDQRIADGEDVGPLAGVPVAAKNLYDVAGIVTRAGSRINRDHPPAARDATLVARLEAAGAVVVGLTTMSEYAYGFTGENVHEGNARNPADPARMSGGSSSGSAVAVAADMVPIALGSDTNGSIRVPAALTGIYGLKPTFGRLSRAGAFPFVASLDHPGPLARSLADLAVAYDVLQGDDPRDPVCRPPRALEPVSDVVAAPGASTGDAPLRLAVADGYFRTGAAPDLLDALDRAAAAIGATARVTIPEAHRARAAAFVVTAAEGGALHLDRLRTRAADFDPAVRDRLVAGAMLPAQWLVQAQRFRRWYATRVAELFQDVDVILALATPIPAPRFDDTTFTVDGRVLPVRPYLGLYTQPLSFIGLPVVTVPLRRAPHAGAEGALPVGVQVIAAPWNERAAFRAAALLDAAGVTATEA